MFKLKKQSYDYPTQASSQYSHPDLVSLTWTNTQQVVKSIQSLEKNLKSNPR